MNELTKFYERAKNRAKMHMKKGQLNAYFDDLIEMNHYKKLIELA